MNYGPFLTCSIEVDEGNTAFKALAIRLDQGPGGVSKGKAFMAFDTDTLRMAAGWLGDEPIDWRSVVFDGSHQTHPKLAGQRLFLTPMAPGWANPSTGSFVSNRVVGVDGRKYGPLDREWAHWKGLYLHDQRVVLSYTVGETDILESPSMEGDARTPLLVRTINVGPRNRQLVLQVAGHAGRQASEQPVSINGQPLGIMRLVPATLNQVATDALEDEGFRFDGRQHFQIAQPEKFQMSQQDFTITAQVKTEQGGTIFSKAAQGKWVRNGKTLFIRDGRLCYDIGWVGVVQSRRRVDDGRWHDVAMSYRAATGRVRLFIDGQPQGQGNLRPKAPVRDHQVRIGYTSSNFPSDHGFVGSLRCVQFFQRALDEAELRNGVADRAGCLAEWHFSSQSSDGQPDAAGRGYLASLMGVPASEREVAGLAVAAVGPGEALQWVSAEGGLVRLKIAAGREPLRIKLVYAPLTDDLTTTRLAKHLAQLAPPADLRPWTRGGPARWPQRLTTGITTTSTPNTPFEVQSLETPESNPWNSWMRLGGFDFFDDRNRAAVCTWQGDVWLVEGLREPSTKIRWQRVATGLFQPLGLRIVDQKIYVLGRDQITIVHDLNGDGECDFYENFNNDAQVTDHFHEFAMDLQTDADGNFYYAKAARHALPALVPHHGTVIMVNRDGSQSRVLARGFRAPNGLLVNGDGTFILSDQEGHWTPMNRINWVRPGKYYGNMMAFNPDEVAVDETEPPVVWIHREIDRSPAAQVWVPEGSWGTLSGGLLSLSYGTGKIYQVLYQDTGRKLQGGIFALPIPDFPTGIQRGRFHDDWLYVCGLFGWSSDKTKPGGFYRVRSTGKPIDLPQQLALTREGLLLRFPQPLDRQQASEPRNYAVSRWNYRRTANYGSDDYRVSNGRPGRDRVPISKVSVSADGRDVFLHIAAMQLCDQMRVRYRLASASGSLVAGLLDSTVLDLPETDSSLRARFGDQWGKLEPLAEDPGQPEQLNPGLLLRVSRRAQPGEAIVRVSRLIALQNAAGQSPDVMLEQGAFDAVWEGFVKSDLPNQARFQARVTGRLDLQVNGRSVPLTTDASGMVCSQNVALVAGLNPVRVQLESGPDGEVSLRLLWETSERVWEPVDPVSLVHDATNHLELSDSQLLHKGRELYLTLNCGRCHATPIEKDLAESMPELQRDSPSLANAGRRFRHQWLHQWIEKPHAIRNQVSMPQVVEASAAADVADVVAYLATLRSPLKAAPVIEAGEMDDLIDQGLVLYEDLGCIGCHHFEDPAWEDPYDRVSLRFVGDKYEDGYLVQFLLQPHAHYAWRKMPDFQLQDDEARALAAFLRDNATSLQPWDLAAGDAVRGKQVFEDRGCGACHSVDDAELPWESTQRPILAGQYQNKGCLAQEDVQRATAPRFPLTRDEREALQSFVQTDGTSLQRRHIASAAERHFQQLRCATCHRRDAVAPQLPIVLLEEGEQGHPPELLPPLTWTGEKLFTPWMEQLLRGDLDAKSRPWLKARMPAFPAYGDVLADGMVQQHAMATKRAESVVPDQELIQLGERLISKDEGFYCLQCHSVPGKQPEGAFESQGIDFDLIPTRVRHEYFLRWMANPPQVDPATKMPRFSPDGKTTSVSGLLDGQAQRQFEALWQYIHSLAPKNPRSR